MAPDDPKPKKSLACPKCDNRLRVRADQIGEQIRCPKCNATFTVGRPAAVEPVSPDAPIEPQIPLKRSIIAADDDPIEIDDSRPLEVIAPMAPAVTSHLPQYAADWATDELEVETPAAGRPAAATEYDYLEKARQLGLVRAEDTRAIPKWTFFSGVFGFPWQLANVTRWVVMALGLTLTGELLLRVVQTMAGGVHQGTLAMPMLATATAGMMLTTLSFCAACFLSAVDDTADGHDEVQDANMPPLDQWFFSFFSVLGIWLTSGALGYPLALVPVIGPLAIPISSLVLFPILLLSAMECGSFLLPWSPNVWRTLVQFPGTWLSFYFISTSLLAGWFVGMALAIESAPFLIVLVSAVALAAVMLIYARLLGRLAWRITFDPAATRRGVSTGRRKADDAPQKAAPENRPRKRRKKVRRLKLQLPDDVDQPAGGAESGASAPRRRLDFHKRW